MSRHSLKTATTYPTVVGAVIAQLRKEKGIKQGEFAARMKIGQSTWSRIEQGTSSLSIEQLVKAAEYLEIAPSKIVAKVDETVQRLRANGVQVANERVVTGNTGLLLIGAAAIAAIIIAASKK